MAKPQGADCYLLKDVPKKLLESWIGKPNAHYIISKPDEHWPWTGRIDKRGYAYTYCSLPDGRRFYALAHRIAYYLAHPDHDVDEHNVINFCGLLYCGNPSHWYPHGQKHRTTADARKQHMASIARGERHHAHVLDWTKVRAMRARKLELGSAYTQDHAAAEFGCSRATAGKVLRGHTWIESKCGMEVWPTLAGRKG